MSDTIHRDETYEHAQYGTVRVLDIREQIDSIRVTDGMTTRAYTIRFVAGEAARADGPSMYSDRHVHDATPAAFLEAVDDD